MKEKSIYFGLSGLLYTKLQTNLIQLYMITYCEYDNNYAMYFRENAEW